MWVTYILSMFGSLNDFNCLRHMDWVQCQKVRRIWYWKAMLLHFRFVLLLYGPRVNRTNLEPLSRIVHLHRSSCRPKWSLHLTSLPGPPCRQSDGARTKYLWPQTEHGIPCRVRISRSVSVKNIFSQRTCCKQWNHQHHHHKLYLFYIHCDQCCAYVVASLKKKKAEENHFAFFRNVSFIGFIQGSPTSS